MLPARHRRVPPRDARGSGLRSIHYKMLDMMPPDGPSDVPLSLGGKSGGFEKRLFTDLCAARPRCHRERAPHRLLRTYRDRSTPVAPSIAAVAWAVVHTVFARKRKLTSAAA